MNKLIQEISSIVSQYGVDIVTEERFVNILKDLYPDRDHPEKFDIFKAIVDEGVSSDMLLNCSATSAKSFLEKQARILSRKYGYESHDIIQVLGCLCIGSGCITADEYQTATRPSRPKPLPSKPQVKPKPSKNTQPTKPTFSDNPVTLRSIIALIWSFLGMCAIPYAYLTLLSNGWWPFWAVAALAVLYFFTILMSGFFMNENEVIEFEEINSYILGAYACVSLFAILFILVGPFLCHWTRNSLEMFYGYFGFNIWRWESPTILTLALCIICCLIAGSFLWLVIEKIPADNPKGFFRGALIVTAVLILSHVIFIALPLNEKLHYERLYQNEVEHVEQERLRISELKKERSAKKMDLSFMDFYLGQDFKQSLAILNDVKDYKSVETGNMDNLSYGLIMDSLRYDPIINRVARANTLWDNDEAKIYLFSNNDKLVAIEMTTKHDIDSIVAIYSEKYGEPEYEPEMEVSFPYYYDSDYNITNPYESTSESHNYSWTFMNSQIRISSSSTYSDTHVLYIDHECEILLGKWVAEQAIKRQEQQRKEDSIARQAAEAERQRLNKERLEKKQNHEKSIKQI